MRTHGLRVPIRLQPATEQLLPSEHAAVSQRQLTQLQPGGGVVGPLRYGCAPVGFRLGVLALLASQAAQLVACLVAAQAGVHAGEVRHRLAQLRPSLDQPTETSGGAGGVALLGEQLPM